MFKDESAFTLIELLIAMVVYAILLSMLSVTVVAFSRLNSLMSERESVHNQAMNIHSFLVLQWDIHNGEIDLALAPGDEETLFTLPGGVEIAFREHSLFFGDREIAYHEEIKEIERTIDINLDYVVFRIQDLNDETIQTIILKNLGGNTT